MPKKGSETIAIRRAADRSGTADDYYSDNEAPTEGVGAATRCILWPRASSSESERGTHTIAGLHVFVPPDEIAWDPNLPEDERELRPEDRVTARGEDWRLDGDVGDWRKRTGNRVGFLFELRRWR